MVSVPKKTLFCLCFAPEHEKRSSRDRESSLLQKTGYGKFDTVVEGHLLVSFSYLFGRICSPFCSSSSVGTWRGFSSKFSWDVLSWLWLMMLRFLFPRAPITTPISILNETTIIWSVHAIVANTTVDQPQQHLAF